jgi:pimeloyl-ACP methyl ester carboxylesterase
MPFDSTAIRFADIARKGRTVRLEYCWVGDAASTDPVVVFLHEGLGSIAMWKDFPERFCAEHGFRGLVFSRYGYGRSTPRPLDQPLPLTYLHEQAHEALPALLAALDVQRPWLFGHSDGGSIALLYAAHFPQEAAGVIAMAPHIFVEDITIAGIKQARDAYRDTDLYARLARYHDDAESVFRGWNDAWLDPAFRDWNIEAELPKIACPVLAVQGEGDEYGTLAQIEGIARLAPHARALAIADCGHIPQRDQPAVLSREVAAFIKNNT